jgi:hypothetical protein
MKCGEAVRRGPREERLQIELLAKDKLPSLVGVGYKTSTAISCHVSVLLVWSLLVTHYAEDAVVVRCCRDRRRVLRIGGPQFLESISRVARNGPTPPPTRSGTII